MKSKKTTGLVAAAFGLVAFFSVEAAAQIPAPTVSASAFGNTVTIDVALPPGALTYTLSVGTSSGASNVAVVTLPALAQFTHIVVNAPSGTYFLRAQAFAGAIQTPVSSEATVTAGSACTTTPAAPTVAVNVANAEVTVSWNAEPGAQVYQVLYSRFAGVTEFAEAVAGTSVTRIAPSTGNFFVKVRVATACGTATSVEMPLTVTSLALGSGPRTPDPAPGQLLPMPSYANAVVQDIARRYAGDLAAHSGPACKSNNTWLFKLIRELRKYDSRWGMNWKRGWVDTTFSTDVVTYNGTAGPDATAQQVYLSDVLSAECEANVPVFNWQVITQNTWNVWNTPDRSLCANRYCAAWTITPYLLAGFPATSPADEREKEQQ